MRNSHLHVNAVEPRTPLGKNKKVDTINFSTIKDPSQSVLFELLNLDDPLPL